MTVIERRSGETSTRLLDLEDQTTPIMGAALPVRVMVVEADPKLSSLVIDFGSQTPSDFDVWKTVRHEPLNPVRLRRRTHAFAWTPIVSTVQSFQPAGTPVNDLDDVDLAWFEATYDLTFRTTLDHWRNLLVARLVGQQESEAPAPSPAWTAFEELGAWLSYSDLETSQLLGLGEKTAYGWRREGHPPQPRLARRLYEAHAFVRQLVNALGLQAARAALARGGEDSALALIAVDRVAEAEARFAALIYSRPDDRPPIGASQSGDEDIPSAGPPPERLPGGRRRVQARRGR